MSLARTVCKRCYSTTATRPELHDVVVLGAGPAGLALTAALASSDAITATHRITLLERASLAPTRDWNPHPGRLSNRVSSITSENVDFLSRAGVWKHVDHGRTRGIHEMQVWDGISDARIEFHAPPSRAAMATLTENLNLQRAALRRIQETGHVELVDEMRVESIVRGSREEGGWPVVHLENEDGTVKRKIRARLLIGADGANSPVKSYSEIETFGWAYDRQGVVSSLDLDPSAMGDGTHTAWQRFLPEGPIAFLPLSDTTASLVWSTTPAYAALLKALPPAAFAHLINLAFCLPYPELSALLDRLAALASTSSLPDDPAALAASLADVHTAHLHGTYAAGEAAAVPPHVAAVQPGSTASFPLRLSHTSSYLGLPAAASDDDAAALPAQDLRTVLVGDAAHTVHPLAGQGLNLGLGDAEALVETLARQSRLGGDVGSHVGLLAYARERYTQNHAVLSACDHLHSLYASTAGPVVWARSTGLEMVNELDAVKTLLMGQAGGGGGGGSRVTPSKRSAGGWGVVASAFEGAAKVRDAVGLVGGLVAGMVKKRATEFVVRGK
ncbi:hypothetical protein JCM11491_001022 [Sporobolomyces phaffii]